MLLPALLRRQLLTHLSREPERRKNVVHIKGCLLQILKKSSKYAYKIARKSIGELWFCQGKTALEDIKQRKDMTGYDAQNCHLIFITQEGVTTSREWSYTFLKSIPRPSPRFEVPPYSLFDKTWLFEITHSPYFSETSFTTVKCD